jgi:hypothetical protein
MVATSMSDLASNLPSVGQVNLFSRTHANDTTNKSFSVHPLCPTNRRNYWYPHGVGRCISPHRRYGLLFRDYSHGRSITFLFYQTITKTTGGFDDTVIADVTSRCGTKQKQT